MADDTPFYAPDHKAAPKPERPRELLWTMTDGFNVCSAELRLPLIALCDEPTRSQVLRRAIDTLSRLDTDQIQIAEIVIAAIARGERR